MGPPTEVTTISPKKVNRYTMRLQDANLNLLLKDFDNELKIAELEDAVDGKNSMIEYLNERVEELKTELQYQRNKREQAESELYKEYK